MKFELKGFFIQKNEKKTFSRLIEATTEKLAKEKLYSLFGSEHRIPRRAISITSINKAKEEVK